MTVETTTFKVTADGNDSATVFSFSPMVLPVSSADLEVTFVAADGTETVLTEGTGTTKYSVSVSAYPDTGSITYPTSGSGTLATGTKLVMKRVLDITQPVRLNNQGGYFPDIQMGAFDRAAMIDQQQQEEIDRAVKVPIGSTTNPDDLVAEIEAAGVATAADVVLTHADVVLTHADVVSTAADVVSTAASAAAAAATLAAGMFSAVQDKSADYAVLEADAGDLLRVDAGSGGVTITLPSIAGLTTPEGFKVAIIKWAGAGNVTVARSSTDTINAATSYTVTSQYETGVFVADSATNTWAAIDQSPPIADGSITLTKLNADVTPSLWQTGDVKMHASSTVPTGWLTCDGSAVSRTTYAALFTEISTAWGAGDGTTTFNLPDFRDAAPVGSGGSLGTSGAVGGTGGSKTHTLVAGEIPALPTPYQGSGGSSGNSAAFMKGTGVSGSDALVANVANASNTAISLVQPYGICLFIIKT